MKLTECFSRWEIENYTPPENSVLISITDPGTKPAKHNFHGILYPLRLEFWDVEKLIQGYLPVTEDQILLIYQFIISNKEKNIFAHCEAGISRSGAIREFLVRYGWTGLFDKREGHDVFANQLVLQSLIHLERKYENLI